MKDIADGTDVPSAWRWQQVLDFADEVMTRWPANYSSDCHLVLTADIQRIRELCRAALRAARRSPTDRPTEPTP